MAVSLDEVVVSATRRERTSFEVPNAVTILGREALGLETPSVFPGYLRGQPGVFVQETTPGQASPIIRGLIGSSVLTLVDGMRLNTAIFRPAPNQYYALVDAWNVERMEVVRGTASTLYGSDAMGGVLNIVTPVPRVASSSWTLEGGALGAFRSADGAAIGRLSLQGGRRGIGFRGGLTYEAIDDVRAGGDVGAQKPSGYEVRAADTSVLFGDDSQELLIATQYLTQPRTPRYDELVPGFGQRQPSAATFLFEPNSRLFLHGHYRRLRPLLWIDRADFHVAYQDIDDDRTTRDFDSAREVVERNASQLTGITAQLSSSWGPSVFTYGAEAYLDRILSSRSSRDVRGGAARDDESRFPNDSTMNSFGWYLENEISVGRLVAVAGGRASFVVVDIPTSTDRPGVRLEVPNLSGNLGLLYEVHPQAKLAFNVGRGFRVPNVFDLSTLGPRPGNRFNVPNPDLGPETIVSMDGGLKFLSWRSRAEIFGFLARIDDTIAEVDTERETSSGRRIVRNDNLASVSYVGVEAALNVRLVEALDAFMNVTYTVGEERVPEGSGPADRVPPVNGRVGLLFRPQPRLVIEPFMGFAGTQRRLSVRDLEDPRIDPDGTAGWVSLNVRLRWAIDERSGVLLAVENVLDHGYREHGSGIDAPGVNVIARGEINF